jgi:hypothetical protein
MSPDAVFSFFNTSAPQGMAFIGFVIFMMGFFVWVARLVQEKKGWQRRT